MKQEHDGGNRRVSAIVFLLHFCISSKRSAMIGGYMPTDPCAYFSLTENEKLAILFTCTLHRALDHRRAAVSDGRRRSCAYRHQH